MRRIEKLRKLVFGFLGILALCGALGFLVYRLPTATDSAGVQAVSIAMVGLFGHFTDALWLIVGAVMVGNIGEHVAGAMAKKTEAQP